MNFLLLLAACLSATEAVDRSKFRTCEMSSFCRSHRGKASEPEVRI